MSDHLLLAGAVLLNIVGFAWLALAMDAHWKQVRGSSTPSQGRPTRLRLAAGAAFLISLILCNLSDHATIAALVWVMALTAGALMVAFMLTWRPKLLRPLSWLCGRRSDFDDDAGQADAADGGGRLSRNVVHASRVPCARPHSESSQA